MPHRHVLASSIAASLLLVAAPGCGRALRFDAERLHKKCEVRPGEGVTETQARCIARVAGLRDSRRCPLELAEIDEGEGRIFRFRESCAEVGLAVHGRDGRVVAVELGDGVAPAEGSAPAGGS